jgi:hypothetical protein
MTTLREAAQQMLEAIDSEHPDIQLRAAVALRAALAQQEQVACDTLAEYSGDGAYRQWVTVGAWLTPGERIVHLGPPPRD